MITHPVQTSYSFYQVPTYKQEEIKSIVARNIEGKLDAYLQKIFSHKPDALVRIEYKLQQNKKGKYEAKFFFLYDGKSFQYTNTKGFTFAEDLVNHAFTHFKEQLSK